MVTVALAKIFVHTHIGGQYGLLSDDAVVGGKRWGELRLKFRLQETEEERIFRRTLPTDEKDRFVMII